MPTLLYDLPDSFSLGTTVEYTKSFGDYPASDGWGFTLYLAGVKTLPVAGVADGDAFTVTINPSDTTGLTAGLYKYVERVDKSAEVHDVGSGVVTISPDLATARDGDEQSWLETDIALLKTHIAGRLPAGMEAYAIAGRQVSKLGIKEAISLLTDLESRLASLSNPDSVSRPVHVYFTKP